MAHHLDRTRLSEHSVQREEMAQSRPKRGRQQAPAASAELARLVPPMARPVMHRLPNSAVRRLAGEDEFPVTDAFERDLRAQRGKGHPLDATVASGLEGALGQDLAGVRVHADETADRLAGSIQARAFTHGQDIYFAHGEYDPHSDSGRHTLVHELAHATDTHDKPASVSSGQLVVGAANDPAEARADAVANSMHGAGVAALRRQEEPEEEEEMIQPLRRQEEEELVQPLRRQEMPEEEEELVQPLRRQEEEELVQPLRRQEEPEEEEVQAIRRLMTPGISATNLQIRREGLPIATAEEEQATAREGAETEESAAADAETDEEQPTHHVNERLDLNEQGRPVGAAELRQRIADAEARGHQVIQQARSSGTRVYEIIPRTEPITPEQTISPNGVAVVIRNATAEELAALQVTLAHVPPPHLQQFVSRRRRLVMVDWTGAPHESVRQMSGGANIARARADIGEEAGSRIEITHTAMASGSGELTVLHEIGHVVYDANLIPRSVARDNYGVSSHAGASEQPAYAYMWYLLNPGRLDPQDRRAFDAAFQRQGLEPGGAETTRPEEAGEEEAEVQPLRRQALPEEEEIQTARRVQDSGAATGAERARLTPIRRENGGQRRAAGRSRRAEAPEAEEEQGASFTEQLAQAIMASPALLAQQANQTVRESGAILADMTPADRYFERTYQVYWGLAGLRQELLGLPEGAETTAAQRRRFTELTEVWGSVQTDMTAAHERDARRTLAQARQAADALQLEMLYAYRDVYAAQQDPSNVQIGDATLRSLADWTRQLLAAINQADAGITGRTVTPLIPVLTHALRIVNLIAGWQATSGLASESEADLAALQNAWSLANTVAGLSGFGRFLPLFGHIGPALNGIATAWRRVVSRAQEQNATWWAARDLLGEELPRPQAMPGGRPVFTYMREIFAASEPPSTPPPAPVVEFFTSNREMFSAVATQVMGQGSTRMPTRSSWLFWTTADPARLNEWAFYHREMVWRLIYGRDMELPTTGG